MKSSIVNVAVGVIADQNGNVLIAKRPSAAHQGGLWEFPGGKVEPGEHVTSALARELHEELGIAIEKTDCFGLLRIPFAYADKNVLLDVWQVNRFSGSLQGREGQPIKWVAIENLNKYSFPAANALIIRALQLPSLIAISGAFANLDEFSYKLEHCLKKGIKLLHLRAQDNAPIEQLCQITALACDRYGARFMINTSIEDFARLRSTGACGLQVEACHLMQLNARPVADNQLFSASCQRREELIHAQNLGADYVFLSPVLASSEESDSRPLGWRRFKQVRQTISLPVYATGGLVEANLAESKLMGAQGIAAVSAFWG